MSEADQEAAGNDEVRKDSISGKTVSFDNPEVKGPNERVSLDQPSDLFVTSMAPAAEAKEPEPKVEAAEASPKADASNTGTAKRKKKKRDEVGLKFP